MGQSDDLLDDGVLVLSLLLCGLQGAILGHMIRHAVVRESLASRKLGDKPRTLSLRSDSGGYHLGIYLLLLSAFIILVIICSF